MSLSHTQILDVLSEWKWEHQKVEREGMCLGLGIMGLTAILAKDIDTFDQRINFLALQLENLSTQEFVNSLHAIEQKRVEAIASYKKEVLRTLHQDEKMNDRQFYNLIKSKEFKKHPVIIDYNHKYKNIDSILDDNERKLSDAHAFFEDVYIAYFSSSDLAVLYKKKSQHGYQDSQTVLQRVLPHALVKKPKVKKIHRFKPLRKLNKSKFKEKPLVQKADVIVGLYNKEELADYLQELLVLSIAFYYQPIGLVLQGANHAIVISYSPEKACWYLVDANKLPTKKIYTNEMLAHEIFSSFRVTDTLTMTSEVYCHKKILNTLQEQIDKRKKTSVWKKLHKIEGRKVLVDDVNRSLLSEVIMQGNLDAFKQFIECKDYEIDVNVGENGKTPFNIAVAYDQIEIVKLMIKLFQPNPNILHADKYSAISLAVKNRDLEMIDLLLKLKNPKIDINLTSKDKANALETAVNMGELKITKILIKAGAKINFINQDGETPLHVAAAGNHLDILKMLLKRKANMNVVSANGNTPLLLGIKNKHLDVVKTILENKRHKIDPTVGIDNSVSPLCKAAEVGDIEILKLLLDPNLVKNRTIDWVNLVETAAKNGRIKAVKFLLEQDDLKNDFRKVDLAVSMAVLTAIIHQQNDLFDMLLKTQWARVKLYHLMIKDGLSLVHFAVEHNNVLALLMMFGSSDQGQYFSFINKQTNKGKTPLHLAVQNGYLEIVKVLSVVPDINPNIGDDENRTPLIEAVIQGSLPIISELLNYQEINTDQPDAGGYTPLYHAISNKMSDAAKLLIEKGNANPYLIVEGYSPLCLSAYYDDLDIFNCILTSKNFIANREEAYKDLIETFINAAEYGRLNIVKAILSSELFLSDSKQMLKHINKARSSAYRCGQLEIDQTLRQFIHDNHLGAPKKRANKENTPPSNQYKKQAVSPVTKSVSQMKSPLGNNNMFANSTPNVSLSTSTVVENTGKRNRSDTPSVTPKRVCRV